MEVEPPTTRGDLLAAAIVYQGYGRRGTPPLAEFEALSIAQVSLYLTEKSLYAKV